MVFVVFVVFVCRIFGKPALQATLRVFGLCGSCVALVWIDGLVSMPMPMPTPMPMPMPMLASCLARPLTRLDARPLDLCGLLKRFAHRPDS